MTTTASPVLSGAGTVSRARVAVQTGSPASVAISLRVVTIECPPAERTESTCRTATSRSPATIGRWWVKLCSPCTTRL